MAYEPIIDRVVQIEPDGTVIRFIKANIDSTDPKPMTGIAVGSNIFERDTGKVYYFTEKKKWVVPDDPSIETNNKPNSLISNCGEIIDYIQMQGNNMSFVKSKQRTRYCTTSSECTLVKGSGASTIPVRLEKGLNMTVKAIGFWFYVPDELAIRIAKIDAYFHEDEDMENGAYKYRAFVMYPGWNFCKCYACECSQYGSNTPNLIKYITISLSDSEAETGDVIGKIYFDSVVYGYRLNPTISIIYDGMWGESYTNGVYDWHIENSIPFSIAVSNIDDPSAWHSSDGVTTQMLKDKVIELNNVYDYKAIVYGGHGVNGSSSVRTGTDVDTVVDLIRGNVNALENVCGGEADAYVYSQGIYTNVNINAAKQCGMKVARTTKERPINGLCKDAFLVSGYGMLYKKNGIIIPYTTITAWIEDLITYGNCGVLYGHGVSENPVDTGVLISTWKAIMDLIKTKVQSGDLQVMGFKEMVDRIKEPF